MCGIITYVGKKEAAPILLDGLYRLEYRGYDSAGMAVADAAGKVQCTRALGHVEKLAHAVVQKECAGTIGIAHTRWATHGVPSEANAHPHTDCGKSVYVVHNGIIENYMHLRTVLLQEGHVFQSDTDSEALSHLIERAQRACKKRCSLEDIVADALRYVEGAFGIAVLSARDPEKIVVARKSSPLILGIGDNEFFAASDSTALLRHTRRVIYLDDDELGILTPRGYEIRNMHVVAPRSITKPVAMVSGSLREIEKGGHPHFMAKEIHEIPEVIRSALRGRIVLADGTAKLGALDGAANALSRVDRIVIAACGTSFYAGLAGAYMIEELAGIPAHVVYASEFRYAIPPLSDKTLVVVISQSGETADTLEAVREAKHRHIPVLAVVNVVGSSIARAVPMGIYTHAGPEISVASTKAFVSQLVVFALISIWFGRKRALPLAVGKDVLRELEQLPRKAEMILASADTVRMAAEQYAAYDNFLYMGRKYNWPTALEGALKLKEISYIHAEGYAAGEMKHGPMALVTGMVPSIIIAPCDGVLEKTISNIQEIKARGGKIIAVATEGNTTVAKLADHTLYIPAARDMVTPVLSILPLQLFAYYVAQIRGCDIDKPRNLAKSVTVE